MSSRHTYIHTYIQFFLFSFVVLLFLSPDSYVREPFGKNDSAWFFTCGKAFMEGMTPYVDFADSKEILLWLIYGIGYLLSPTTYHGVFWLSVIAYSVTFMFVWRIAKLFLNDRGALFSLVIMSCILFCRAYHKEVRAEDFCMPWLVISLYFTCKLLAKDYTLKELKKGAFWIGLSMMVCLLIKWNYFVLLGGVALVIVKLSIDKRSWTGILYGLLGMLTLALPFMIYFIIQGNFNAFIQEYFITTFNITYANTDQLYKPSTRKIIVTDVTLVMLYISIWYFCRKKQVSYWLCLVFLPFFLFYVLLMPFNYYYAIAAPFFLFPLIILLDRKSRSINKLSQTKTALYLTIILIPGLGVSLRPWDFTGSGNPYGLCRYYTIQKVLAKKDKPLVIFGGTDFGEGLLANALPGCKYWALQNCPTKQMLEDRINAIRERKPDFVINPKDTPRAIEEEFLHQNGYYQVSAPITYQGKTEIVKLPVYARR